MAVFRWMYDEGFCIPNKVEFSTGLNGEPGVRGGDEKS